MKHYHWHNKYDFFIFGCWTARKI